MIKFVTLFVGLIVGVQNVETMVSGPVASVQIQVNGSVVAEATEGPWRFTFDLGREIHPIRLEAVAYDESGRESGRDAQWINLPDNNAEAAILPEFDEAGEVMAALLTWESAEFDKPRALRVRLDGEVVHVHPPYRVDLTAVSPEELHVLDVEFEFTPELCLKRQLAFGRGFSGDHTSGLTAVPVSLGDLEELPAADQMSGWFTVEGKPLRVTDVEHADGRLVVVRDPGAEEMLKELSRERERQAKRERRRGAPRTLDLLDERVEIRVLVPEPVAVAGRSRSTLLFPYSKNGVSGDQGILKAAAAPKNEQMLGAGLMLPDAVAMAGLHASEGNRRRAVLLILGPEREDVARLDPDHVRGFLRDLHVPLVVWDLSGPRGTGPQSWRPDREIETFDDFARATRRLRYALEEQRIVWVGGRHLPQDLALSPEAEGISLVE